MDKTEKIKNRLLEFFKADDVLGMRKQVAALSVLPTSEQAELVPVLLEIWEEYSSYYGNERPQHKLGEETEQAVLRLGREAISGIRKYVLEGDVSASIWMNEKSDLEVFLLKLGKASHSGSYWSAIALRHFEAKSVTNALTRALEEPRLTRDMEIVILESLILINGVASLPTVIEKMEKLRQTWWNNEDYTEKKITDAIKGLGKEGCEAILKALDGDDLGYNWRAKCFCLEYLSEMKYKKAFGTAKKLMKEYEQFVCERAGKLIISIKGGEGWRDAVDMIKTRDGGLREIGSRAIVEQKMSSALMPLVELANKEKTEYWVRDTAIETLCAYPGEEGLVHLLMVRWDFLNDFNPRKKRSPVIERLAQDPVLALNLMHKAWFDGTSYSEDLAELTRKLGKRADKDDGTVTIDGRPEEIGRAVARAPLADSISRDGQLARAVVYTRV